MILIYIYIYIYIYTRIHIYIHICGYTLNYSHCMYVCTYVHCAHNFYFGLVVSGSTVEVKIVFKNSPEHTFPKHTFSINDQAKSFIDELMTTISSNFGISK